MNIFKKSLVLILVITIMIGVSGCTFQSNEKIMLEHLKQKYGQEFIKISMGGLGYVGGSRILYCYPTGGDREVDEVSLIMSKDKNGEISFSDNYFGNLIREELEAEILAILSDFPQSFKAYYNHSSNSFDESFDGTKTYSDFKEWINAGNSKQLSITIAAEADNLGESEKEKCANQIFDAIEKEGLNRSVDVRFYPNKVFEKLTRKNVFSLYRSEYSNFYKSVNEEIKKQKDKE